ncbi:MAG: hypothetical protein PHR35_13310 [Kiritimatiellae bacterium]|nr:hypothetical protein [Kiritimatiellia bacterium]
MSCHSYIKSSRYWLLAGGLLLWATFSWPLPRHFSRAIPAREVHAEAGSAVRDLDPGDHLQLLYHFWLTRDMLAGHTPLFTNLYEFNTGDDAARYHPDPLYLPFSLVYALLSPWAGDAAAWNLSLLLAFLLGVAGSHALARRYTGSAGLALAVALTVNAFPYRWITLLCGSPTGFAMGLIPWLLTGLDVAVRDRRSAGGWLAGASILAAYGTDLHVFYFSALIAPAWCILAWCADPAPLRPDAARLRAVALALLPAAALAAAAVGLSLVTGSQLARSDLASGRSWNTIRIFSPTGHGFYSRRPLAMSNHIFLGFPLLALLGLGLAGCCCLSRHGVRKESPSGDRIGRPWLLIGLLLAGLALVCALAMGANGPLNALAMRAARKLLPKYTMIRQTVKVFCLMPAILTVFSLLLFSMWRQWEGSRARGARWAAVLLLLLTLADFRSRINPGLCALPARMPAYEEIARHAASRQDQRPHAIALPLWPGESHYASVYEYGIAKSRVRLVNGYAPAVPLGYHTNVFRRFESLNQGALDEAQVASLRAMGVRYAIFHEQPYPERVSPFPAAIALRRLLQHPWLEPIAQDGQMWSFFLRDAPRQAAEVPPLWGPPLYAATLHWSFPEAATKYPLRLRAPVAPAPGLHYLLRVSGAGRLAADGGANLSIDGENARWIEAPFTPPCGVVWQVAEGAPRIEHALLTAGDGAGTPRDGVYRWPAASLFHQGATDARDGSVALDPARDPQGLAIYGPGLPFPSGCWRARLLTAPTEEGRGVEIGRLIPATIGSGGRHLNNAGVIAGLPAVCDFAYDGVLPLRLEFHYHRHRPARVLALELERLDRTEP